jgi:hypothetical protein
MTWGQLRFTLLQSTPGLSLDLLDTWLNSRYESVLGASDWTGIHARATIQTQASYQSTTDTATLTIGSTDVVGVGTSWGTSWPAVTVGSKFYRTGDTPIYTVTACVSAVDLTLDRPYEGNGVDEPGTVYAGAGYVLMQNIYPLPADCRAVESILDAVTGFPLTGFTQAELDASAGPRNTVEDPQCYAMQEDSPESAGNPLHQVELYPPPKMARGYTVEYLRAAYAFDGTNLAQSPLPFVSQSILLYGVRADIAVWQGKLPAAQIYEAKFQEELKRLLMIEHSQRRSKPKFQMADRFTRHRLARSSRGFSNGWRGGEPGGPN